MPRISPSFLVLACLLCAGTPPAWGAAANSVPLFSPRPDSGWVPARPEGDDFISPESGPGPVVSEPGHPYIPNNPRTQPTYRIADLTNPILKPWVIEKMRPPNEEVRAGKVPFTADARCWPGGVPGFDVYAHVRPIFFLQTEKQVTILEESNNEIRRIYMNVPHSKNPKPSWYGESVGHYEGDELVVDTIGMNDKSFVDNYRTPHTDQIHVIERFKLIEDGKQLQVNVWVEDPGAFNMPWTAIQRWRKREGLAIEEQICGENPVDHLGNESVPIPQADRTDF
jgi:hypothetical protein